MKKYEVEFNGWAFKLLVRYEKQEVQTVERYFYKGAEIKRAQVPGTLQIAFDALYEIAMEDWDEQEGFIGLLTDREPKPVSNVDAAVKKNVVSSESGAVKKSAVSNGDVVAKQSVKEESVSQKEIRENKSVDTKQKMH